MDKPQIGWAGLGKMGNAMVLNLLSKGFTVNVYNRTKGKEKEAVEAGALPQQSLQQLVHNSSIIFTMLTDDDAVRDVFTSEQGLLSHAPSGKIFVDMSTVSPTTSRAIAEACIQSSNMFLDAPVSGSIKPAREGSLLIMAGGDRSTFEKVKPVFEAIGKIIHHLGEVGAGTSAKLALNYFLSVNLHALAEMVVFAKQKGVEAKDMLAILKESSLASIFTGMKSDNILLNDYKPAFALKHIVKDLRLAGKEGLKTPLYAPAFESFLDAEEYGLGEEDCAAVMKYIEAQY